MRWIGRDFESALPKLIIGKTNDEMQFVNALLFIGIVTAAKLPPTRVVERAATCTPAAGGSSSIDDVPAIQSAIAACPSGTIVIPPSSTYYINSVFSFKGCSGCTLQVEGLLKVASDTDYWNGKDAIFDGKAHRPFALLGGSTKRQVTGMPANF